MQATEYSQIFTYLSTGALPPIFSSNKSNFTKKASKFSLNGNSLFRDGLPVVKWKDRRRLFDQFHEHYWVSAHISLLNLNISEYQLYYIARGNMC